MSGKFLGIKMTKFKKWLLISISLGFGLLLITFVISSYLIGSQVKALCKNAQNRYQGDCVQALQKVLTDEASSFHQRNDAIWALGQIGDVRALETLERYYSGEIPKREPYEQVLSQHELKKALKLLRGGFNLTQLVWSL